MVRLSRLRALVHSDDFKRFKRLGLRALEYARDPKAASHIRAWQRWSQEKPASERRIRLDPDQTLGPPDTVAWFTPRRCLQNTLGNGTTNKAQRARDALGLIHQTCGTPLVALHFPGNALVRLQSNRPTFLDAADHARFKAWPDSADARAKEQWGFTVDLEKLTSSGAVDGCPERVTCAVSGRMLEEAGLSCEVEILGCVNQETDSGPDAHHAFARRLSGDLSACKLADKLKSLLP